MVAKLIGPIIRWSASCADGDAVWFDVVADGTSLHDLLARLYAQGRLARVSVHPAGPDPTAPATRARQDARLRAEQERRARMAAYAAERDRDVRPFGLRKEWG